MPTINNRPTATGDRSVRSWPACAIPVNPRWVRMLTPGRQATILSTIDPLLTLLDRLRYQSCTRRPRSPIYDAFLPSRVPHLPQLLWSDWAVRLTPTTSGLSDHLREVAPCWLLNAGRARQPGQTIVAASGVKGQTSGWTRVERFATTMAHPTVTEAADAIGINRTTLLGWLHLLEADVGTTPLHRATANGKRQTANGTGPRAAAAPYSKHWPDPTSRPFAKPASAYHASQPDPVAQPGYPVAKRPAEETDRSL
jgi:hypothetical protein